MSADSRRSRYGTDRGEEVVQPRPEVNEHDGVYQPIHYKQWPMEPFTFIMLNQLPFSEGTVIKYVMRWRKKDGIKDLRKAIRVLEMMIEMETNGAEYTPPKGCL